MGPSNYRTPCDIYGHFLWNVSYLSHVKKPVILACDKVIFLMRDYNFKLILYIYIDFLTWAKMQTISLTFHRNFSGNRGNQVWCHYINCPRLHLLLCIEWVHGAGRLGDNTSTDINKWLCTVYVRHPKKYAGQII